MELFVIDLCVVFTVRLNLSIWEDTGAWDMCRFFICIFLGVLVLYGGDRVPVHGFHVTPGPCGLWDRVLDLTHLVLTLCRPVRYSHAIIGMWDSFFEIFWVIAYYSFYLWAFLHAHMGTVLGSFLFGIYVRVVFYMFLFFGCVQLFWHFIAVPPPPHWGWLFASRAFVLGSS